jgi:hypothetical protein
MVNRLTAIILTCAVFAAPALAQQRRQGKPPARPASAPSKVTTQTATTRDGKIVLLHSDGTWEYSGDNPSATGVSQPAAAAQAASLNIEAGLVYRSGDSKPVARTDYYLLDKSAAAVIREAGVKLSDKTSGTEDNSDRGVMFSLGLNLAYRDVSNNEAYDAAMAALKQHIIKSFTTDFGGKATIDGIPQGDYYVFGFYKSAQGFVIWNIPVTLKPGSNSLTLDQNNADFAK